MENREGTAKLGETKAAGEIIGNRSNDEWNEITLEEAIRRIRMQMVKPSGEINNFGG